MLELLNENYSIRAETFFELFQHALSSSLSRPPTGDTQLSLTLPTSTATAPATRMTSRMTVRKKAIAGGPSGSLSAVVEEIPTPTGYGIRSSAVCKIFINDLITLVRLNITENDWPLFRFLLVIKSLIALEKIKKDKPPEAKEENAENSPPGTPRSFTSVPQDSLNDLFSFDESPSTKITREDWSTLLLLLSKGNSGKIQHFW